MSDSKDCEKYISRQTSFSTQELDSLDWSTSDNNVSFIIRNNKNISDFLGIRR
jgi:hypothetical protein